MLVILDAGHGIETPGKRSPKKRTPDDGKPGIVEYEFNRDIVSRIETRLGHIFVPTHVICQDEHTMTLADRVKIANTMTSECGPTIFISVHSNAVGSGGWVPTRGFRAFVKPNAGARSRTLASCLMENMIERIWQWRGLSRIKEGGFYMLKRTRCPAVLTENGFMTSKDDCSEILTRREMRQQIADAHVDGILEYMMLQGEDI